MHKGIQGHMILCGSEAEQSVCIHNLIYLVSFLFMNRNRSFNE